MTIHHVAALFIAAALFLTCEVSGKCSDKMIDHAAQLASAIVIATFAHAQGSSRAAARRTDQPEQGNGK